MGGPHLAPERKDGGEALALAGGATARATVERRANLASGVVGAEDGEGAGELRCYSGSKAKHGWFWLGARLRLVPYVSVGRGRWAGLCYSWAGSTRGRRREESPLSLSLSLSLVFLVAIPQLRGGRWAPWATRAAGWTKASPAGRRRGAHRPCSCPRSETVCFIYCT
jgi:hypothetical protein